MYIDTPYRHSCYITWHIFNPLTAGSNFRHQILMPKVNPYTERIQIFIMPYKLKLSGKSWLRHLWWFRNKKTFLSSWFIRIYFSTVRVIEINGKNNDKILHSILFSAFTWYIVDLLGYVNKSGHFHSLGCRYCKTNTSPSKRYIILYIW